MIGIINWLKGFLRISVSGKGAERFLNLCGYRNIVLWDISKNEYGFELNISIRAFKELREIVRKTKVKVVILQKEGLPFFVSVINKRKIFLFGFMIALFIWTVSGYFLWDIEITGNYHITKEQINDYLYEKKIHIGIQKKKLNIEALEKDMRLTFPQIKWISGKLDGTTLLIDLKESVQHENSFYPEENTSYNIVAHTDGLIESIIVRKGVPKVKQGDEVTQGTVLVEGIVPVMNDDGTLRDVIKVKSDADIYIRHVISYEESLAFKYVIKEYTGRIRKIPYIRLGDREFLFGRKQQYLTYDNVTGENSFRLFEQLHIPIGFGSITHREYLKKESLYSEQEASAILNEKLINFLDTLSEKGVQIIEKDVKIEKENINWKLTADILVSEPVNSLISSENNPEEATE